MNKRAVWLGILVLVIVIFSSTRVISAGPLLCYNNKGVYCLYNDACLIPNSQSCLLGYVSTPCVEIDCVVAFNNDIDVNSSSETIYYAKSLQINSGVTLNFSNTASSNNGGGVLGSQGNQGAPGRGGSPGGNGGAGGKIFNKGDSGTGEHNPCNVGCDVYCTFRYAGEGGIAGAKVSFSVLEKVINNGLISVDGQRGTDGKNGEGGCGVTGSQYGNHGAGGGGGGGAGQITITTVTLEGTGTFSAKGGANGFGGVGGTQWTRNNPDEYKCSCSGCDNDHGAPAGYGGAGDGGNIIIHANNINSHFDGSIAGSYNTSGGRTTYDGVPNGVNPPYPINERCGFNSNLDSTPIIHGTDGTLDISLLELTETEGIFGYVSNACNDGFDNDGDGFIDMADSDCYNLTSNNPPGQCNSANLGYFGIWTDALKNNPLFFQSAQNGLDGCCGDDLVDISSATFGNYNYLNDYGFIHNINNRINNRKQYLCYEKNVNLSTGFYDSSSWINAMAEGKYRIKTIQTLTGEVDAVSNSKDWYYCNATGNSALQGNAIAEGKTFPGVLNSGQYSCAEMYTAAFGLAGVIDDAHDFYDSCVGLSINNDPPGSPAYSHACCKLDNNGAVYTASDISGCNGICFLPNDDAATSPPPSPDADDLSALMAFLISTDSCTGDYATIAACLANLTYLKNLAGEGVTVGGITGTEFDINYYNYIITHLGATSNKSFICTKENNSDIISQCCYSSSCINKDYATPAAVSYFSKRIQTRGSTTHTIENYDELNHTNAKISDNLMVYKLKLSIGPVKVYPFYVDKKVPLDTFSSLEFDILTDTPNLNVTFNTGTTRSISLFTTNGFKAGKWHHMIIPVQFIQLTPDGTFTGINFSTTDTESRIIILDNLAFVAEGNNSANNTKNYYCSGGFGEWIDDLDPSLADRSSGTFELLGPHHIACIGNPAYSWTGNYCCGDDTRATLIYSGGKEYFNDTEGGCFEGSKVKNDVTVAFAKGYTESTNKFLDDLHSYNRKNLMYINNSYKGCQVPTNDIDIKIYYDNWINDPLLSTADYIKPQCTTVGSYYCRDGVWRQKIDTDMELDINFNVMDETAGIWSPRYPESMQLKKTPAGIELIKNGFRP